jgi:hypothetical protein
MQGLEAQYNSVDYPKQGKDNFRLRKFGADKRISNEGMFLASADA